MIGAASCSLLIAIPLLCAPPMVSAQEDEDEPALNALRQQILVRELEILEMNAKLKLHTIPSSPWAGRRWFFYSFTNAGLTSTGALINAVERLENEDTAKRVNKFTIENAATLRLLANCISVIGAGIEFTSSRAKHWWDGSHGFNMRRMCKRVDLLQEEIDACLNEFDALVKNDDEPKHKVEARTLREVREIALAQFAEYFADLKGFRARQNVIYVLCAGSNAVSGAGTYVGIHAGKKGKTKVGGTGGITDTISGSLNMLIPVASRGTEVVVRSLLRKWIARRLQCDEHPSLVEFKQNIEQLRGTPHIHAVPTQETDLLLQLATVFEKEELRSKKESKVSRKHLEENETFAIIGGGSKITNGIGGLVGNYRYVHDPRRRLSSTGAASVVYGAGTGVAGADQLRQQIMAEIHHFRQQRDKDSAVEIVKGELKEFTRLKESFTQ